MLLLYRPFVVSKNSLIGFFNSSNLFSTPSKTTFPLALTRSPRILQDKSECFSISFFQFAFKVLSPHRMRQCSISPLAFNSCAK